MRQLGAVAVFTLVFSLAAATAAQQPAAPAAPAAQGGTPPAGRGRGGPLPPATQPVPRDDARHQSFLEVAKAGNIDLLFVGDSITDWWRQEQRGLSVWNEYFAPLKAANFGIAGDTTQGVLWRMQNGELEGFQAKLIVLMLGTNNINRNTNADIAQGNRAIVEEFKRRQPNAKILLLGVFPRGAAADNPFRASIKEINSHLQALADNERVFYMDIGDKFLAPDGTLPTAIMPDGLHPNTQGYRIWAEAIAGRVRELIAAPKSDSAVLQELRDRLEIEDLMWRYARALDTHDADAYAAVYTSDGEFRAGANPTRGRDALRKMVLDLRQRAAEAKAKGEVRPAMYHMTANHRVTFFDKDRARIDAYWITAFGAAGANVPLRIAAVGRSVDELVRVNGQWLIKARSVTPQD